MDQKQAIMEYQCPGCIQDIEDFKCYSKGDDLACANHHPGTIITGEGVFKD